MAEAERKRIESEHYAWNRDTAKRKEELAAVGAVHSPKPVSAEHATVSSPSVGSAWNAAGTWEEKDVSSKGRAQMKDKLTSSVRILDGGAALTIKNVSKCEGEVRQLMVRGQKRVGYELNVSAQWVLVDAAGSSVAAGSLRLDEITDTDSDIIGGIAATCTSCTGAASNPDGWRDASSCVSTMKRGMLPWLRDIVREWVEEMKRQ